MEVKDRFNLASKTDDVFVAEIANINEYREPSHKYFLNIYKTGEYFADVFCSE